MPRKSLREFILGIKRSNVPQGIGALFLLDEDTDTVYACALGRGIIDYNDLSIEDLRKELKAGVRSQLHKVIVDGETKKLERARSNNKLEDKWNAWISDEFGVDDDFMDFITGRNDDDSMPAPQIARDALDRLIDDNTWDDLEEDLEEDY